MRDESAEVAQLYTIPHQKIQIAIDEISRKNYYYFKLPAIIQ